MTAVVGVCTGAAAAAAKRTATQFSGTPNSSFGWHCYKAWLLCVISAAAAAAPLYMQRWSEYAMTSGTYHPAWPVACRGDRIEKARLYKAHNEQHFAVQIATNNIAEGVKAAAVAQEAGAAWLDINCGCPIHGERHCIGCSSYWCGRCPGC